CACCGDASELRLPLLARSASGSRTLLIPYCRACAAHVQMRPHVPPLLGAFLTLVTFGVFFVLWLQRLHRAQSLRKPSCSSTKLAIAYVRSAPDAQHLDISCRTFASVFMQANRERITQLDKHARNLLDNPAAQPSIVDISAPVSAAALA